MSSQTFHMQVAGIVFRVTCQYASTLRHCGDYLTEEKEAETIYITPEDIEGERRRLLSKKNPGEALEASTPEALERLQLCRRIAGCPPAGPRCDPGG